MPQYSRSVYAERLEIFQTDIASLTLSDTRPMPDFTSLINHDGKEPDQCELIPGFYLNSKTFNNLANRNPVGTSLTMTPDDAQKVTREDSRHQVFLGYLDFLQGGSIQYEANIAVKSQKAELKELAYYQLLGALGVSTFKPFGFIVMPNGNQHLLTKVRKSVKTIDSTEWSLLTQDEMWETARAGIDTMLLLNRHMLFQGDLEFRNVAIGDFAEPVAIDPEFMTSLRDIGDELKHHIEDPNSMQTSEAKICLRAIANKMGADFTALTTSTKALIFPSLSEAGRPASPGAIFKKLKRHYYEPYRRGLMEMRSPYQKVLLHAYDVLLAKRREEVKNGVI